MTWWRCVAQRTLRVQHAKALVSDMWRGVGRAGMFPVTATKKIDATKTETSLQAAAYALAGATLAVSALGFVFEKKVAVVDIKPAPT